MRGQPALLQREAVGFGTVEDGFDEVWREQREPEHPRQAGVVDVAEALSCLCLRRGKCD